MADRKRIRRLSPAPHVLGFRENVSEVNRLLQIHTQLAGSGPGYKHNVQVLNKSAIVLLVACWEAYIEDLAENCFNAMLSSAKDPSVFPEFVLAIAAKRIKKQTSAIWGLAHDGWRDALNNYKREILEKYIVRDSFNTPSPRNIDKLFSELIGLTSITSEWYWPGTSAPQAQGKLEKLIELRGNIAHRVGSDAPVYKSHVNSYKTLLARLGTITHNRCIAYIYAKANARPWRRYHHGKTR